MALHKVTSEIFAENPDKWGRELSERIELELLLMNLLLRGIDSSEIKLEGDQDFAGIPRLQNLDLNERKRVLRDATVINTFLSMFRNVVLFIDKLLALQLVSLESQKKPIGPIDDLEKFLEELPREAFKNLTRKSGLSFPTKLEMITALPARSKERLLAYNKIRVSFEHHGGIPKQDIIFPISTFEREGDKIGYQRVIFRLDKVSSMQFQKDQSIKLKTQDVSLIGTDIKAWIIKDVLVAITSMS